MQGHLTTIDLFQLPLIFTNYALLPNKVTLWDIPRAWIPTLALFYPQKHLVQSSSQRPSLLCPRHKHYFCLLAKLWLENLYPWGQPWICQKGSSTVIINGRWVCHTENLNRKHFIVSDKSGDPCRTEAKLQCEAYQEIEETLSPGHHEEWLRHRYEEGFTLMAIQESRTDLERTGANVISVGCKGVHSHLSCRI